MREGSDRDAAIRFTSDRRSAWPTTVSEGGRCSAWYRTTNCCAPSAHGRYHRRRLVGNSSRCQKARKEIKDETCKVSRVLSQRYRWYSASFQCPTVLLTGLAFGFGIVFVSAIALEFGLMFFDLVRIEIDCQRFFTRIRLEGDISNCKKSQFQSVQ